MSAPRLLAAFLMTVLASPTAAPGQNSPKKNTERLGTVHFATSCNSPAQKEFNRSVALLHSFQFSDAIDGFNATLKSDPTCAIADWGIALSDWSNPFAAATKDPTQLQAGRAASQTGLAANPKTDRERAYLTAVANLYTNFETTPQQSRLVAYRDAMKDLAVKYPDDHEAQIFYALSLAASADPADQTYAARLQAGAILEKLFAEEPTHPGLAHYLIHTYDVPSLAPRALEAARRYSEIAPDAPHALHMPSHTFTRTGDWSASISSNIAAAAAAKREGQTAEELHCSDYLVYAYLQTGQDQAARQVLTSLPEIESRFDPEKIISGAGGPAAAYFALAAIPARYALERQKWNEAARLDPRETPFPYADAITWFARGVGAARLVRTRPAYEAVNALTQIREKLWLAGETYWARQVEIQQFEVAAWAALAATKPDEALAQMKTAAEMEDATDKSAITPGPLAPARELLGEMYLQLNQPAEALQQFEATLTKEPRRFRALYGAAYAAQLSANPAASQKYFRELLKVCDHPDTPPRPELTAAQAATTPQN
ncbi:MAG TPA: hypothetical protein VGD60_00620 [Candidatus Acidoferrales bacterium]